MEKGTVITILAVVLGAAFVGGVWAQNDSAPGVFSGTVIKVDRSSKELAIQNKDGQMTFRWNDATRFSGIPAGNLGPDSKDLKEGIKVTIAYSEGDPGKNANWIYVQPANLKAVEGFSLPFECGVSAC